MLSDSISDNKSSRKSIFIFFIILYFNLLALPPLQSFLILIHDDAMMHDERERERRLTC